FYEAELGSKHPDTLNVAVNIGSSHQLLTNLDEAEKFLSFAHENSSRYLGEMHPIAQRAICTLSVVYINRGENEKAIQTLTPILNVAPGNTSVQQQRYASCARILGVAHQAQGSYDKAHAAFTKSLEVQTRQLGANHADTLRTKYELGTNYGYRQDYHQAALVLEEVLPEQQHVLGEDHYQTLDTKSFLAQTYIYFERNEEAEKLLKDVYEKIRSQRGDDHPDTYTALGLVCVTYVNRMLALKADDCFKNTILGLQNTLGSDSPITLGMLNHWADALTKFGRYSEAEAVLKGTFNTMLTQRDANSHDVLMVRYNIICLHALQGRKNQAIKLFEELVADGFRSEFALTDSKLDSLRGEPEFDNIIAKIKRHTSNTDS
ncbi:MAG: tetratricopeptide repeat protein, partial [Gammaproteobacteria bacterium]|nr:tetratricopeptide repeat protein [Gammaproteobacteria bacterium]